MHLRIEIKKGGLATSTDVSPRSSRVYEVLVGSSPGVDWGKHCVVKRGKLGRNQIHIVYVLSVSVVDIVEHKVGGWASLAILVQSFKVVVGV